MKLNRTGTYFKFTHLVFVFLFLFFFAPYAGLGASYSRFVGSIYTGERPSAQLFEIDAGTKDRWVMFFKNHQSTIETHMSYALETVTKNLLTMISTSPDRADQILDVLVSLRGNMPDEFRWMVAAFEVERGRVTQKTIADLTSIASRAMFKTRRGSGGFFRAFETRSQYSIDCPPLALKGETRERDEIFLDSAVVGAFLMSSWHRVVAIDPASNSVAIERKRIEWIDELKDLTSHFEITEIEQVIKHLHDPAISGFSNGSRKREFLENALEMLRRLSHRYGKYQVNKDGDLVYLSGAKTEESYKNIRTLVSAWVRSDIIFFINNLTRLLREGLIKIDQVFKIKLNENEKEIVKRLIIGKSASTEGYLAASLLLLNQKSEIDLSDSDRKKMIESLFEMLTNAEVKYGLVSISERGLESTRTENDYFYSILGKFYDYFLESGGLSAKQGIELFDRPTVKAPYLTAGEFDKFERKRLNLVSKTLSYDEYKKEMIRRLSKGTTYSSEEQLRVADVLNDTLRKEDRSSVGRIIHERFIENKFASFFRSKMNWDAELGWPIQLMLKVNPDDSELHDHLVSVIVERKVQSAISAGDALMYLMQIKSNSPKIKTYVLHHLRFPEAGDTNSYFLALVRLFPEAVTDILGTVYRFRQDVDKIVPLLTVLINECIINPTLLSAIRNEIENGLAKAETKNNFGGFNLAEWLTIQVNKKIQNSCIKFYRDTK